MAPEACGVEKRAIGAIAIGNRTFRAFVDLYSNRLKGGVAVITELDSITNHHH